jgi:DNA primase
MVGSPVEEIKNRLDIVDVVSSYVKLSKCGQNFRGLCPFHSEKKPSFFVSPRLQIFKCFGCGSSGDIFKFIMQIENVEFYDALKILAERAGIELKPIKPEIKTEIDKLLEICELSTQFFETQLHKSKKGEKVKNYLLKRGIKESSIKKWRLGYAPKKWDSLLKFLVSRGFQPEEIEKAGLIIRKENYSSSNTLEAYYDRFRSRIIFPIFDLSSRVVGFGGRIIPTSKDVAKYINTPNTLLYNKSQILYGLNFAKSKIREKKECILVEGYTDLILAHQEGFENSVALSGTSLNPQQLQILKRYTSNLLTAFDMDIAGDMATKRGIDLAQEEGFNIKVILMPEGADPADIISKEPQKFKELVEKAKPILDFYFENTFLKFPKKEEYTPYEKKEISKILLPVIKKIKDKIEQSSWVQKLARDLDLREEAIFSELEKINLEEIEVKEDKDLLFLSRNRKDLLEEKIISLIFQIPKEQLSKIFDKSILLNFSEENRRIVEAIKENNSPPDLKERLSTIQLQAEVYPDEDPLKELEICQKEFKKILLKEKLNQISKKIKKARKEGNEKEIEIFLKDFNKISKELLDLL